MLVLTRKVGETVQIGEPVGGTSLTVLDVGRGEVRLGFDAPPEVPIWRGEVVDSRQRAEVREAAYAAVYDVIRQWPAPEERGIDQARANARVWRAVEAALAAAGLPNDATS
jgi:carbon storage regulator